MASPVHAFKHTRPTPGSSLIASSAYQRQPTWIGVRIVGSQDTEVLAHR